MKAFINYLRHYLQQQSYKRFLFTVLLVAILVTLNYTCGIERRILALRTLGSFFAGVFYVFYGGVLVVAWRLQGWKGVFGAGGGDRAPGTWDGAAGAGR